MVQINPSELALFSAYLTDLQTFVQNGGTDYKFYNRWQSLINTVTEISTRLDGYLATKDSQLAQQVEHSKRLATFQRDEFMDFKDHVAYYLSGIGTYNLDVEAQLIQDGLLEKPIQEMTGLEFKTLLLATLNEHSQRQKK